MRVLQLPKNEFGKYLSELKKLSKEEILLTTEAITKEFKANNVGFEASTPVSLDGMFLAIHRICESPELKGLEIKSAIKKANTNNKYSMKSISALDIYQNNPHMRLTNDEALAVTHQYSPLLENAQQNFMSIKEASL